MDSLYVEILRELPLFNALINVITVVLIVLIYKQVRQTNGRVIKLEMWAELHERADRDFQHRIDRTLEHVRNREE
jgi:hypothetical protein